MKRTAEIEKYINIFTLFSGRIGTAPSLGGMKMAYDEMLARGFSPELASCITAKMDIQIDEDVLADPKFPELIRIIVDCVVRLRATLSALFEDSDSMLIDLAKDFKLDLT